MNMDNEQFFLDVHVKSARYEYAIIMLLLLL